MRKKQQNPFVYKGYEGPDYFCDRTEETEAIVSGMQNGRNITTNVLFSFHQQRECNGIYVAGTVLRRDRKPFTRSNYVQ